MSKSLLFTVTARDCVSTYTRGTGNGGQKKNKTSSAVYCKHEPSGAQGYAEDTRSQTQNKRLAFKRMAESKEFRAWHKMEVSRRLGYEKEIEQNVEREMRNIRIEGKDENGRWKELTP